MGPGCVRSPPGSGDALCRSRRPSRPGPPGPGRRGLSRSRVALGLELERGCPGQRRGRHDAQRGAVEHGFPGARSTALSDSSEPSVAATMGLAVIAGPPQLRLGEPGMPARAFPSSRRNRGLAPTRTIGQFGRVGTAKVPRRRHDARSLAPQQSSAAGAGRSSWDIRRMARQRGTWPNGLTRGGSAGVREWYRTAGRSRSWLLMLAPGPNGLHSGASLAAAVGGLDGSRVAGFDPVPEFGQYPPCIGAYPPATGRADGRSPRPDPDNAGKGRPPRRPLS
jgi:hypothetical protein